jgi:hypothetical protein
MEKNTGMACVVGNTGRALENGGVPGFVVPFIIVALLCVEIFDPVKSVG